MKKLSFILCILIVFSVRAFSQADLLIIDGVPGKFYLNHTVKPGENWYSVGRLYNVNPKELAPFNNLSMDKSLVIGEPLKMPLTRSNFSQNTIKNEDETLVPLYHIIQEKEWFYHISTTYNKVPIENLEKWNHVKKEQAKAGMELVVGFLKVKTAASALAKGNFPPMHTTDVTSGKKDETATLSNIQVKAEAKPEIAEHFDDSRLANRYSESHAPGGYFRSEYNEGNKSVSGDAGTFKSTSGWQDGKYYALLSNNVPVGTIVKITSSTTNKSIYAKVLGQLPDMKESAGLTVRISNAAAAELGTGEGRFPIQLFY